MSFRRSVIIPSYGGLKSQVVEHFVSCAIFVEFGQLEISKVVHYLPDKKKIISPRSLALTSAQIAPKI